MVGDDSRLDLTQNNRKVTCYLTRDDDAKKTYGYDSNNNPLSGEYKSSIMPEYKWVFENGVFISTTADS